MNLRYLKTKQKKVPKKLPFPELNKLLISNITSTQIIQKFIKNLHKTDKIIKHFYHYSFELNYTIEEKKNEFINNF
jgi:hypothetical protein